MTMKNPSPSRSFSIKLLTFSVGFATAALFPSAQAANLYWDINGVTANEAGPGDGAWDGTTANWNTDITGTGGTPTAVTTATDDLFFSSGSVYTGPGTPPTSLLTSTVSSVQSANSLSFTSANPGVTAVLLSSGGTIAFGAGTSAINVASGVSATIGSFISGTNGLTKTGEGTLTLGPVANTGLTGTINIKAGILNAGAASSNSTSINAQPVSLGDTTGSASATFAINNNNTFNSAITVNAGSSGVKRISTGPTRALQNTITINGPIALNDAVTIGNGDGGNVGGVILSGVITGSSTITIDGGAAGNLTPTGAGTVNVLSGNNTTSLTSTINVNRGSLRLTGTNSGGIGTVNVQGAAPGNASIQGTGTALGDVFVTNGSVIAPGSNATNSAGNNQFGTSGILALGSGTVVNAGAEKTLTLTSANLFFDLNTVTTSANDRIDTNNLSLGSTIAFTFNATGVSIVSDGVTAYTLINANAVTGFDIANISTSWNSPVGSDLVATYSINGTNDLVVTFVPVPEPGTWILLIGGLGVIFVLRRRLNA
jgi:fibronectin-binding autotransporter adhesin